MVRRFVEMHGAAFRGTGNGDIAEAQGIEAAIPRVDAFKMLNLVFEHA